MSLLFNPVPPGLATFDSATAMLRATAAFLHGRDFPTLGEPRYLHPAAFPSRQADSGVASYMTDMQVMQQLFEMLLRFVGRVTLQFEYCQNIVGHGKPPENRCLLRQVAQAQVGTLMHRHLA